MLFDDDEWLQCPDHRKLKAWKQQPGGGWLQYFLEASEFPHPGGDGTAWEMGHGPLGAWSSWLWPGNWTKRISVWSVMTREEDFCDKGKRGRRQLRSERMGSPRGKQTFFYQWR